MDNKQTTQKEAETKQSGYIWMLIGGLIILAVLIGVLATGDSTPDTDDPTGEVPELTDQQKAHIAAKRDLIRVDSPEPLEAVSSPLEISGEARGQWFFEATFPVQIMDANGNQLGQHYAEAQGEWMTEQFVPFTAELEFTTPTTDTGTLILQRSNPSGLPENADELRIPIRFADEVVADEDELRTVQLYYYNPEQDTDANGNIMCSEAGLTAVEREIPVTQTPLQDTLRLLMKGELTSAEAAQGITTEFPLAGLELTGVSSDGGTYTLGFSDPNNTTSGGSCRANILWQQIKATALQFDSVEEVEFQPETLFQP